ncbi:MAG: hypothetical protein ABI533_09125 [Betaproteobacteria bacterium]
MQTSHGITTPAMRAAYGGGWNKVTRRTLDPVRAFAPVREFFTYQYCVRAVPA